jgi:Tol biopolymer transport system component
MYCGAVAATEPLQLTFPPGQVFAPSISPDGKQVVYTTFAGAVRLISMDGGSPQTIAEKDSYGANWSPDGNLLVFADSSGIQLFDLGTGKRSVVLSITHNSAVHEGQFA